MLVALFTAEARRSAEIALLAPRAKLPWNCRVFTAGFRAQVVGNWSYHVSEWDILPGGTAPVQMVFMGVLSIDSSGNVTGPGTFAMGAPLAGTPIPAGQALDYDFVSGSIRLTQDCTGLLSTMMKIEGSPAPPIGPYIGRIVVLPAKDEIVAMCFRAPRGEKPMWTYVLKRVTHVPASVEWPQPQQ